MLDVLFKGAKSLWRERRRQDLEKVLSAAAADTGLRESRHRWMSKNQMIQKAFRLLEADPELASSRVHIPRLFSSRYPLTCFLMSRAPLDVIEKVYSLCPKAISFEFDHTMATALHIACQKYSSEPAWGKEVIKFIAEKCPEAASRRATMSSGTQGSPLDVALANLPSHEEGTDEIIRFLAKLNPGALNQAQEFLGSIRLAPSSPFYRAWQKGHSLELMEDLAGLLEERLLEEFRTFPLHDRNYVLDDTCAYVMTNVIVPRFKHIYCQGGRWTGPGLVQVLEALADQDRCGRVETLHIELNRWLFETVGDVQRSFRNFLLHNHQVSDLKIAFQSGTGTRNSLVEASTLLVQSLDMKSNLQTLFLQGLAFTDDTLRKLLLRRSPTEDTALTNLILDGITIVGPWETNRTLCLSSIRQLKIKQCSFACRDTLSCLLYEITSMPRLQELTLDSYRLTSNTNHHNNSGEPALDITPALVELLRPKSPLRELVVGLGYSFHMDPVLEALCHNKSLQVVKFCGRRLTNISPLVDALRHHNSALEAVRCAQIMDPNKQLMRYYLMLNKYGRSKLRSPKVTKEQAVELLCGCMAKEGEEEGESSRTMPEEFRHSALFEFLRETPLLWCV